MCPRRVTRTLVFAAFLLALSLPQPAEAQWQLASKDGSTNIKIGFLVQPQAEALETADQQETSKNLFVRRFRILFSGALSSKWTFFFETDSPNLGKVNPNATGATAAKDAGDVFIQDAFVTYNHSDVFKVDVGMIMLPHSRNGTQSAATLLAVDYGPFTFLDAGPSGERVGRDYGVQLRGYPAKQHLEYRLAVAQGTRGDRATNPLRVSGRAVYYPFGAETGFFYGGTFQGTKKQVGIGAGFDAQDDHRIYSADAFAEFPVEGRREGVTLQANWMHYDGGTFLPALPEQDAYLVEAGYHVFNHRLSPFVQYQARRYANPASADQDQTLFGAAYWLAGHQRNIKLAGGWQHVEGQPNRFMAVLQLQIFYF
jgi:hypothetical protein